MIFAYSARRATRTRSFYHLLQAADVHGKDDEFIKLFTILETGGPRQAFHHSDLRRGSKLQRFVQRLKLFDVVLTGDNTSSADLVRDIGNDEEHIQRVHWDGAGPNRDGVGSP